MRKPRDPFDVKLDEAQKDALGVWLCDELNRGIGARAQNETEVDYWWTLYEQGRTRRTPPWPGAADLTSHLGNEKVNALHARIMRSVWTDPALIVEGWGDAQEKAPFVEEFHQWKSEEEQLPAYLDKLILQSLVEPRGLIEVSEGSEWRVSRRNIQAQLEQDPYTGGTVYGEDGAPKLATKEDGDLIEATDPQVLSAEVVVDKKERVRTGPVYRILPYRDSVMLPGHARDQEEIWAYGKRFWRRYDELKARASQGVYDAAVIEKMSATSDRQVNPSLQNARQDVASPDYGQAEKELWELLVLLDLDAWCKDHGHGRAPADCRGERWYLTTIHPDSNQLLRIQFDDIERSRYVPVILFPRVDRVTEGYSFLGHQLGTTIEEHTTWRNVAADRAHFSLNAPLKRMQGALWDPYEQPWAPGQVIDVRDQREIEAMVVPDVTAPAMNHIAMLERTAERVSGLNDIASGQVNQEDRTLGEVQMASMGSEIRTDLIVKRFQMAFEQIAQIRHAIWKRTLADMDEGMDLPPSVLTNLEGRGVSIDQYLPDKKVTAELLDGAFRFKPRGSVETADPNRQRQDLVAFLQAYPAVVQANPTIGIAFQSPLASRSMLRWIVDAFRIPNPQSVLGNFGQDLETQAKAKVMQLIASMPQQPGMPGLPGMAPAQPMALPGGPPQANAGASPQAEQPTGAPA